MSMSTLLLTRVGRALAIAIVALSATASAQDDVKWLGEVNAVPADIPREQVGELAPLSGESGAPIDSVESWRTRRADWHRQWRDFLGAMPEPRPAVRLEVLRGETDDGVRRELVRYEGEPGVFVEGYLLRPAESRPPSAKRAGIVALHQTTARTIDEISGVAGRSDMAIGVLLARRGFVVFCPRCFLWQDVTSLDEAVARHRERHPRALGMAKMLYDAQRAVDVLVSLDDVDPGRIGAIGHSLGAKETLYLAAFDERVRAAVASEGGLGFRSTNWDAPWYLGPSIFEPGFPLNHHQLVALIAPRPFLVLGGESGPGAADGERSWAILEPALPVWRLFGTPARLGLLNHRQGHSLRPEVFERADEWLETYLR